MEVLGGDVPGHPGEEGGELVLGQLVVVALDGEAEGVLGLHAAAGGREDAVLAAAEVLLLRPDGHLLQQGDRFLESAFEIESLFNYVIFSF